MAYDLKASFQHSARYNEQANQEMFAALAKLTGRARRREVGAWFGSIHGVLNPSNCRGENGHMSVDLDTPYGCPAVSNCRTAF